MQRSSVMRNALNWDDVRLFLALARSRTVGKAGKALGVDASTVSRRLVTLEEALGAKLFQRGRDGITATEAVEELLPVAEEIEEAMTRFANTADGFERVASGLVRITCPPDVAEVIVVPILPELRARHAALRIEINPSETIMDLTRREADLALRTVRPKSGDLVFVRLAAVRWVVVAGPKLARSLGTLRAWSDAPWVGWGERLAGIPPARWLATQARGVEPVVRSDSMMLQIALTAAGVGVSLLPDRTAQHYGFEPVKVGSALRESAAQCPSDEIFLVTHRALRQTPRIRAVWDLIAENFDHPKPR